MHARVSISPWRGRLLGWCSSSGAPPAAPARAHPTQSTPRAAARSAGPPGAQCHAAPAAAPFRASRPSSCTRGRHGCGCGQEEGTGGHIHDDGQGQPRLVRGARRKGARASSSGGEHEPAQPVRRTAACALAAAAALHTAAAHVHHTRASTTAMHMHSLWCPTAPRRQLTQCRAPRPPRSQTGPARWTRRPRPSGTSHLPRRRCPPAHDRTGRSTCGAAGRRGARDSDGVSGGGGGDSAAVVAASSAALPHPSPRPLLLVSTN